MMIVKTELTKKKKKKIILGSLFLRHLKRQFKLPHDQLNLIYRKNRAKMVMMKKKTMIMILLNLLILLKKKVIYIVGFLVGTIIKGKIIDWMLNLQSLFSLFLNPGLMGSILYLLTSNNLW